MAHRIVVPFTKYTTNRLLLLVKEMRDAQKACFSTKSPIALTLARRREVEVDRLVACIDFGEYQSPPEAFEEGFFSAPEAVQEWFLEHPEFAGYVHVAPAGALPSTVIL